MESEKAFFIPTASGIHCWPIVKITFNLLDKKKKTDFWKIRLDDESFELFTFNTP